MNAVNGQLEYTMQYKSFKYAGRSGGSPKLHRNRRATKNGSGWLRRQCSSWKPKAMARLIQASSTKRSMQRNSTRESAGDLDSASVPIFEGKLTI